MKALAEVGVGRLARFVWVSLCLSVFRRLWISPLRVAFLRAAGARIGRGVIVHRIAFINVDRGGFRALRVGDACFLGDEVLLDLAGPITLEEHVTLAVRTTVLTHMNVGYREHPLQGRFPAVTNGVTIRRGSFVGAGTTVLPGCTLGPEAFVGAASLVTRDVTPGSAVAGVPARPIAGKDPA